MSDPKVSLALKNPETEDGVEFILGASSNYAVAVKFFAVFIESRAGYGDMTTEQVFDELKVNICARMRQGFDEHGTQ